MTEPGSMLLFMPWCRLDKAYRAEEIELMPYSSGVPNAIPGLDASMRSCVDRIMGMYKTIEGRPVDRAAVIRFAAKPPLSTLDDDEITVVDELITIACFTALSKRQYFGVPDVYCNTDCFLFHAQRFTDARSVAFSSHRRAGRVTDMGWSPREISITIPMNCHNVHRVTLDGELLAALVKQREAGNKWGRWQNALSSFNQANTDSSTVQHQVEWVQLCSAFEHLLGAKSDAKDVAGRFTAAFQPVQDMLVSDATRRSPRSQDETKPLRFEWMREFYRIRGDFAHGKLVTQQPMTWNALEHLVLATIAFPLVVKSLLQQQGRYELSNDDRAQIDIFERFADTTEFLRPPTDQKGSNDTHWVRLFGKQRMAVVTSKGRDEAARKLREKFPDFFRDSKDDTEGEDA
ncbi:hypothetical protein LCGC14_1434470 [marine sediment metagenome]|uniref:Apea-like HEPN domain-containing protein n=1 Tax=marine sediment metagenome TaxID=412755 RepID=A0A0F9K8U3_9ZZZZ